MPSPQPVFSRALGDLHRRTAPRRSLQPGSREARLVYSWRSADAGSRFAASHAGTKAAVPAASASSDTATRRALQIDRPDPGEEAGQAPGGAHRHRDTDAEPDRDRCEAAAQEPAQDRPPARAEGEAQTDLPRAGAREIGDDPEDPDRRQEQPEHPEESEQARRRARQEERVGHRSGERSWVADRHSRVQLPNSLADRRQERAWVALCASHQRLGPTPVLPEARIEEGPRAFRKRAVLAVADDADDLGAVAQVATERRRIRPEPMRQGLVDDDDAGRVGPSPSVNGPAGNERDAHRFEVP